MEIVTARKYLESQIESRRTLSKILAVINPILREHSPHLRALYVKKGEQLAIAIRPRMGQDISLSAHVLEALNKFMWQRKIYFSMSTTVRQVIPQIIIEV